MIRYYAYYSCGGYKDLYLGNSSLKTEYTYFLPLLATWQKGAKPEYAEKLKQIEGLTQIEVISKENHFDFPIQAKNLFSHGGYRVIYLTLANGDTCLCVRDITNGTKDEEDRDIPFNILITASREDDVKILDQFCLDSLKQQYGFYGLMSSLFSYDPQVNGIKFYLGRLDDIIYNNSKTGIELVHKPNHVNFLVVDSVTMVSTALSELNLRSEQIDYIKSNDGRYIGCLEYKVKSDPVELAGDGSQTTKSEDGILNSDRRHEVIEEGISNNVTSVLEESDDKIYYELLKNDSSKSEALNNPQTRREEELIKQYSDIERALRNLSDNIRNIENGLDASKSTLSFKLKNIFDSIDSLKDNTSSTLPVNTVQHKEDDSITISKIHLWIAVIALIVGFLLGALIF